MNEVPFSLFSKEECTNRSAWFPLFPCNKIENSEKIPIRKPGGVLFGGTRAININRVATHETTATREIYFFHPLRRFELSEFSFRSTTSRWVTQRRHYPLFHQNPKKRRIRLLNKKSREVLQGIQKLARSLIGKIKNRVLILIPKNGGILFAGMRRSKHRYFILYNISDCFFTKEEHNKVWALELSD